MLDAQWVKLWKYLFKISIKLWQYWLTTLILIFDPAGSVLLSFSTWLYSTWHSVSSSSVNQSNVHKFCLVSNQSAIKLLKTSKSHSYGYSMEQTKAPKGFICDEFLG